MQLTTLRRWRVPSFISSSTLSCCRRDVKHVTGAGSLVYCIKKKKNPRLPACDFTQAEPGPVIKQKRSRFGHRKMERLWKIQLMWNGLRKNQWIRSANEERTQHHASIRDWWGVNSGRFGCLHGDKPEKTLTNTWTASARRCMLWLGHQSYVLFFFPSSCYLFAWAVINDAEVPRLRLRAEALSVKTCWSCYRHMSGRYCCSPHTTWFCPIFTKNNDHLRYRMFQGFLQ